MRKAICAILLITISSISYAQEEAFNEELKLPEAHYSPKLKKTVVEVAPDYQNQQNLEDQEKIINKLEAEVGAENLIVIEKESEESK